MKEKDVLLWKKWANECVNYPGSLGSFHSHLCSALKAADSDNIERLRKGFPTFVNEIEKFSDVNLKNKAYAGS